MSKSRAIFAAISRMPPALMLVIIIGAAVTLTVWITANEQEQRAQQEAPSARLRADRPHKKVLYALSYLPAHAPIEAKQVALRDTDELAAFDDAEQLTSDVIGKAPAHGIPENAQIRKIDFP